MPALEKGINAVIVGMAGVCPAKIQLGNRYMLEANGFTLKLVFHTNMWCFACGIKGG
jgi:hypothetical protein